MFADDSDGMTEHQVPLGDVLKVTAPFWRMDLESGEDYVEEIGRIYGYDQLPIELPVGTIPCCRPRANA